MSVWERLVGAHKRATAMAGVPLLLLGPRMPLGPAVTDLPRVAQGVQLAAAAPDLPPYEIGYVSSDVPRILTINLPDFSPPRARPRAREAFIGEQPSASDQGAVAFVRHRDGHVDTDLAYLTAGATTPLPLTADDFTDRHPALSPDGTRVAFESDRGGQPDIWVIRVNGTDLRQITNHPAEDAWPTWSPSGDRIAFSSTRDDAQGEIYTVSANGGAVTRITTDPAADTEPAFAPSGGQIAFTTTRFGSTRVIATVKPTGGEPTRLIPGEQAAWSPDSSTIAYVSRESDPSGDVRTFALADGAQTVVSAQRATAETNPAWRGVFSMLLGIVDSGHVGDDVWAADALGGDRHDLTNRPELSETGPAYSPDGELLAYTEFNDESAGRLVVSDADGRNRRALTDFVRFHEDLDPTWSPDGKMIAFSRSIEEGDLAEPSNPAIEVIRVADGTILGSIPAPSNLSNVRDFEPAWSPDGAHIAFVRRSTTTPAVPTTPLSIGRTVRAGSSTSVEEVISTPVIPPTPDIVLMIDATASMGPAIQNVKDQLHTIVSQVKDAQPFANFAVVTYKDGTACDPEFFAVRQGLTGVEHDVQQAVDKVTVGGGCDDPEDWINALWEVSHGTTIAYRPDSSRILVLVGDAPSHDPSVGHTLAATVRALGTSYRLVAVAVETESGGLDSDCAILPPGVRLVADPCIGQAKYAVQQTGGTLVPAKVSDVAGAILTGLTNLPVTVTPTVQRCDPGLTVTLSPPGPTTVTGGVAVHYRQTIAVAGGAAPGTTLNCAVTYTLSPSGGTFTVPIEIRVARPDLPLVNVDDVTVFVPGPNGVIVNYNATAVDSAGGALTPMCKPLSGTMFPIGQTLVTCIAVDSSGRVGTDTALISVSESDADRSVRIWVSTLTFPTPDSILVTAQADLGTRVGAPCSTTPDDAGPAWSTDGSQLAFTRAGRLCVTDATGGHARTPLAAPPNESDEVSDPAWSPDGMVIAFAFTIFEDSETTHTTLRTVPVGGGPHTVLIDTPGDALQPAFRPLVTTGLTVTITAAPQPAYVNVKGPPIVVKAVGHNSAKVAARRVRLTVQVPSELGSAPAPAFVETLAPGADITLTVSLPAKGAVMGTAVATLAGSYPGDRTVTAQAQTPILVIQPVLLLEPIVGPPGFVPIAVGTGFPPGTTVALKWNLGISAHETAIVAADGTFRQQVLVFHHDQLGPRLLIASGTGFGDVNTGFLVVPGTVQPDDFVDRR